MTFEGAPRFESSEALKERIESFEQGLRAEVLGRICTPGEDDEKCMALYGKAFQDLFDRMLKNKPDTINRWEISTQRDALIEDFKNEVELEVEEGEMDMAA